MMDRYCSLPIVLALSAAFIGGCSTDGKRDRIQQQDATALDPQKAFLKLDDIEPRPVIPVAGEEGEAAGEVKPLSIRAERQYQRARNLMTESRFAEANAALERALRYQPNHPKLHAALAQLHLEMGNADVARGHAEKSIAGDPLAPMGYYAMGRFHTYHGEFAEALNPLRTALALARDRDDDNLRQEIHAALATALEREGYFTASLGQIEACESTAAAADQQDADALDAAERNRLREMKSNVLAALGRLAEAATTLEPLVLAAPNNIERGERCVRLWLRAEKPNDALRVIGAIRDHSEASARQAFPLLLEVHQQNGTLGRLVSTLRESFDPSQEDPAPAVELFEALQANGKFADAVDVLDTYLQNHPQADVIRSMLIEAYVKKGDPEGVLAQCSAGLEASPRSRSDFENQVRGMGRNPRFANALLNDKVNRSGHDPYLLGLVAWEAGKDDLAITLFQKAHEKNEQDPFVRAALAESYYREYRYDQALAVAKRLDPEKAEDGRLERVLGDIYERLDQDDRAEVHYRAAIQENRGDALAAIALARVLLKTGQTQRARLHLTNLLERNPKIDDARELLAKVYFDERKVEATIEQYQKLVELSSSPMVKARCEAVLTLRRNGDLDAYRKSIMDAIEAHGADGDAWLSLAESYDNNNLDKSLDAYRKAFDVAPEDERTWKGLLQALEMMLRFEDAAELQEQMLSRRPNRHAWRFRVLRLLGQTLQYDRILTLADREVARTDLDPVNRRRYRAIIAGTLADLDRKDEQIERLASWLDNNADDSALAVLYADALAQNDQSEKAIAFLEERLAKDPGDDFVFDQLIKTLHQADRHDRAIQLSLSRFEEDPLSRNRVIALISAFLQADQIDDAVDLLRNQMLQANEREAFQDIHFQVLLAGSRYREALEYSQNLLDNAVEVMQTLARNGDLSRWNGLPSRITMHYPDRPYSQGRLEERIDWLRLLTCDALTGLKEYNEARSRIVGWLEITRHPRIRFLYLRRLRAYQSLLGKTEESAVTAERALMMEPEDVGLNNDVAYGWIDQGERLEEAERRSRYAVFSRPSEGAYLDTYGWLMYKKADFQAARKWLTRAAAFQTSGDAVIYDHLGDACWRLGRKDEAVKHWKTALEQLESKPQDELDPDSIRVKEQTPVKIEAADTGSEPILAPLGKPTEKS